MSALSSYCASTNALHQIILIEANALQRLSEKRSVRFWKNVSAAFNHVSNQLQAIPERYLGYQADRNSTIIECPYSTVYLLSISSLRMRAQGLLYHAKILRKSSQDLDLFIADIFMDISLRQHIFLNGLGEDVPVNNKEVLEIMLTEIVGRCKYMQNKILLYSKRENGILIVFVLNKLCRIAGRQKAILQNTIEHLKKENDAQPSQLDLI